MDKLMVYILSFLRASYQLAPLSKHFCGREVALEKKLLCDETPRLELLHLNYF